MAPSLTATSWVGAAPVAQFLSGPSCGQGGWGACRSKGTVLGQHVPDRFGLAAGDLDRGDLGATFAAVAGTHPLHDRPVAAVAAGGVGGLDQRPTWEGPASQGRGSTGSHAEDVFDASWVALPYMGARGGGAGGRIGLRRLIPDRGNVAVPGALLERAANSSVGGAVLAWDRSGGLLELREDVVGAAGDLARDGQGGALAAAALLAGEVERVVGTTPLAGVVGGFDERPSKLRRALLAELAAAPGLGRFGDDRIEACGPDDLAGAAEAVGLADLGQEVGGEHGADAEDRAQRLQAWVAARTLAQLGVDDRELFVEHRDQHEHGLDICSRRRW